MAENKIDFEAKLRELEDVVGKLEDGSCSLEESIKLFERGIELSGECEKFLNEAQQKIKLLSDAEKEKTAE